MELVLDVKFSAKVEQIMRECKKFTDKKATQIDEKGFGNYVTNVDLNIDRFLRAELVKIVDSGFITEELEPVNGKKYVWVIDPIDGTTNFIYGLDYAISVGLRKDGELIFGAIYVPEKDWFYYAIKGQGSYKKTSEGITKLHIEPARTKNGLIITGVPYDRSKSDNIFEINKKMVKYCCDMKRIGPASLDICKVAENVAQFYYEFDVREWDCSGGIMILEEAGGKYTCYKDLHMFGNLELTEECIKIYKEILGE